MGTRNLTCVVIDGEYKVAQYGQWDGYPSGQGLAALAFLSQPEAQNRLKQAAKRCRFLDQENNEAALTLAGGTLPTEEIKVGIIEAQGFLADTRTWMASMEEEVQSVEIGFF